MIRKFIFAKATMSSGTREITDCAPASMKSKSRPLRHFVSRVANPVSIYKPISKVPASRSIPAVNFAPGQELYGPCASPKIAAPGARRGTKTNGGMKANQTFIPSPSAFILSHVPHTFAAVSSITSSLRNCSSSVNRLPRRLEAKPHCGLIANCSRGR